MQHFCIRVSFRFIWDIEEYQFSTQKLLKDYSTCILVGLLEEGVGEWVVVGVVREVDGIKHWNGFGTVSWHALNCLNVLLNHQVKFHCWDWTGLNSIVQHWRCCIGKDISFGRRFNTKSPSDTGDPITLFRKTRKVLAHIMSSTFLFVTSIEITIWLFTSIAACGSFLYTVCFPHSIKDGTSEVRK